MRVYRAAQHEERVRSEGHVRAHECASAPAVRARPASTFVGARGVGSSISYLRSTCLPRYLNARLRPTLQLHTQAPSRTTRSIHPSVGARQVLARPLPINPRSRLARPFPIDLKLFFATHLGRSTSWHRLCGRCHTLCTNCVRGVYEGEAWDHSARERNPGLKPLTNRSPTRSPWCERRVCGSSLNPQEVVDRQG